MPVAEGKEGETKNEAADRKEHKPETKQAKSRSSSPAKSKGAKAGTSKPLENAAEPKQSTATTSRPTTESKAKSAKSKPDRTRNAANSASSRASASSTASEAKATTGTAPLLNAPAERVPTSKPAPGAKWRERLKSPTAGAASKAPAAQTISNRNDGPSASSETNAKSASLGRGASGAWCCFSPLVCAGGGSCSCCSRNSTLEIGPPDPDARDSPGCASREGCVLLWCNSEFLGGSCHTFQYACCTPLACAQRGALGFGHACLVGWGDLGCGDQCCGASALGSGLRNHSTSMPPPPLPLSSNSDAAAAATSTDPNVVARNALLKGLANCARPDDVGGVRVLGTDRPLLDDVALLHPVVRLHAVNIHTGHYLQWQPPATNDKDKDNSSAGHAASNQIVDGGATLLWERGEGDNSDGHISSSNHNTGGLQYGAPLRAVAPVATHPFPLRRRMAAPRWGVDEAWGHGPDSGELLLDAPYASLLHPDCLLLVEVVDFGCAGRPVGGAKGRKPYSAHHHHHHGSSGDRFSGLTGGDDDDEDDDDIDDDEGPLGAGGYSGPGMRSRGNSLNRSGHHHHHSSGGGGGHLAAASTVGRSGPSPKGTAAARVRKGQGYTGVCWGFLKPIGRGGRPTVGVRGSNLGEAAWGATPRTDLDVGGVDRLGSGGRNHQPNPSQEGNNSNDNDDGSSDVARMDRRVSLQLFRWQELGPVALAQAIARGLAPLPAPAASPAPLVYLQWLLRARRCYPATLTLRVGPVPRSLALRRCGAGGTGGGGGLHHVRSAFLSGGGLGLHGGKRAHLEALLLGGGARDDNGADGRFPSLEAAAGNNGMGTTGASAAASASMLGSGDEPMEPHVLARAWQPGERCAVPDRVMARCVLGGTLNGGTTALAFSHSGRFLAVAAVAASSDGASGHSSGGTGGVSGVPLHPLLIFDVNKEDGRTVLRGPPLVGHVGVVHALAWSLDDKFLLSASSDGTARVWNMARITHRRKMEQEARAAAQAHALADAQAIAQKFMEADESKATTNDENNANAANSNSTRIDATRNEGGAPMDSVTDDDALDIAANDEGAALLQPPPMRRAGSMSGGVPSTATASVTEDGGGNSSSSSIHNSSFGAGNDGGVLVRILAHSPPAFIHAAAFLPTLASESKSAGGSSSAPGSPNTATSSPNSPKGGAKAGAASSSSVPLFLRGCPRVVSCASDGSVRLWDPTAPEHPDLGLFGGFRTPLHRRGATAVAVDTVSRRVYTADADGVVWPWVSTSGLNTPSSPTASPTMSPEPSSGNGNNDAASTPQSSGGGASYCPDGRPLSHSMLRGRCVTSLALQPSRRNPRLWQYAALNSGAGGGATNGGGSGSSARHLLVAAQGNVLLLFDLGARALLATYLGASIRTSPIKACFSPDGRYVLCGSEEGSVSVWNAENDPRATLPALPPASISPSPRSNTGAANPLPTRATNPLVASMPRHPSSALTTMAFNAPMLCVAWNPAQHAVALGAAGGPYPVLLACTDKPLDDDSDDVISFPVGTLGGGGGGGPNSNNGRGGFAGGLNGNSGEEDEDARVIAARLNLAKREKVRAKLDEAKAARAAVGHAEALAPGGGLANDFMTPRGANQTALLPETAEGFTFGGGGGGYGAPSVAENYPRAAGARDGFSQEPSSSAVDLMSRTAPLPNEVPNLQIPSMSKTTNDALDAASF